MNDYKTEWKNTISEICEYYHRAEADILQHHLIYGNARLYQIYAFDWQKIFSPIEQLAWESIREKGIALYPQYPVGRFVLDFAHPVLKIGLELDGKDFHDLTKDRARDTELCKMGWKIYRITGAEMCRDDYEGWEAYSNPDSFMPGEDADEWSKIERWISDTGDGIIEALKVIHFEGRSYIPNYFRQEQFTELVKQTLHLHHHPTQTPNKPQ